MAKEIVPNKVIINLNPDGTFKDGVIQYRIKENGVFGTQFKSIGMSAILESSDINAIIASAIATISQGEGI